MKRINWEILALTRFILAFIVMCSHLLKYTAYPGPLTWVTKLGSFQAILGFLLISGLSIGKSISRNSKDYFKRRAERIYPVYLVALLMAYLASAQPLTLEFIGILLANVFFLNQITTSSSYIGPAWSLSLEVWLYCLAPSLMKLSRKWLLKIIYISFGFYLLYTCSESLFHLPYYAGTKYGINILLLSFVWILGFLSAVHFKDLENNNFHIKLIFITQYALTVLIQLAYSIKNHRMHLFVTQDIITYILEGMCLTWVYCVVALNHKMKAASKTWKKIFILLGNISYPLYMTHGTTLYLCQKYKMTNWLLMVIACFITAFLVYYIFDFYSKRRDKLIKPITVSDSILTPV